MEKRGTTRITDIRELVRKAQDEQKTIAVQMGKSPTQGLVVVATGKRAQLLRKLIEEFDEL